MSATRTRAERRERARLRGMAGCTGSMTCPCLCHDTQGGVHDHFGEVCQGREGIYEIGNANTTQDQP